MAAWAFVNTILKIGASDGKKGFEPYPYILLNLSLSMVAGSPRRDLADRRETR